MQVGFSNTLDSHPINHTNSKLTIKPKYIELGLQTRYNNEIFKEMAAIDARLKNHAKIKTQVVFSARFGKQDEEVRFFTKLNFI